VIQAKLQTQTGAKLMPGNCDALNDWMNLLEQRQADAKAALDEVTKDAVLALEAFTAAEVAVAACNLLIPNPVAYAICEIPALVGLKVAKDSVDNYKEKAQKAGDSYQEITAAITKLQELLNNCQIADADQNQQDIDSTLAAGQGVFETGLAAIIPDVSDQEIQDVQELVADAESATKEAERQASSATA
jgi:hypothetical protein